MAESTVGLVAASWTWPGPMTPPREVDWPQTLAELAQRWLDQRRRRGRHRRGAVRTPKEER